MYKQAFLLAVCLGLGACRQEAPVQASTTIDLPANAEQAGALSGGAKLPPPPKADVLEGTDWPRAEVASGQASISCQPVPADNDDDDRKSLTDLSYPSVVAALERCTETGTVHLHYAGKIATDFTMLMERVANVAERLHLGTRVLDLDSSGGHVEDAMKAGDAIGASRWTLRVGEDAICHSACVLILAAGDDRQIAGKVGIHRMIRVDSAATTRTELNQELREVYAQMKDYLERNGAAVTVADLMMTVPNRKLRLLTEPELLEYGLDGTNAVQDDLERIRLTRKCGDEFVQRRDDFARAFDRECVQPGRGIEDTDACGLELRQGFGFPDRKCPLESPLSERDRDGVRVLDQAGSD